MRRRQQEPRDPQGHNGRGLALVFCLLLAVSAAAQRAKPEAKSVTALRYPPVPTVTFTLDFPQAMPAHYVVRVESSGKATIAWTRRKTASIRRRMRRRASRRRPVIPMG